MTCMYPGPNHCLYTTAWSCEQRSATSYCQHSTRGSEASRLEAQGREMETSREGRVEKGEGKGVGAEKESRKEGNRESIIYNNETLKAFFMRKKKRVQRARLVEVQQGLGLCFSPSFLGDSYSYSLPPQIKGGWDQNYQL